MAKLVEGKIKDSKPRPFRPSYPINSNTSVSTSSRTNSANPILNPTTPPIRKLTPAQLQEKRAQGLCYNCDEKYIPGHKCTTPKFLLLLTEEDEKPTQDPTLVEEVPNDEYQPLHFQLSSTAFMGNTSPKVFKFAGLLLGLQVSILVDTESSHNIIQPRLAHYLHLPLSPIPLWWAMVKDFNVPTSALLCPYVSKHTSSLSHVTFYI